MEQEANCGGNKSKVCGAMTKSGEPCRVRTTHTFPCCWQHTMSGPRGGTCAGGILAPGSNVPVSLRVMTSRIPGAGKGLFIKAPKKHFLLNRRGKVKMGWNNAKPRQKTRLVFEKNTYIAQYTGKQLTKSQLKQMEKDDTLGDYVAESKVGGRGRHLIIDARQWCSGVARYANDACMGRYHRKQRKNGTFCSKTNVEFRRINNKLWLVSLKDLYDGDELYLEYGRKYWETENAKQAPKHAEAPKEAAGAAKQAGVKRKAVAPKVAAPKAAPKAAPAAAAEPARRKARLVQVVLTQPIDSEYKPKKVKPLEYHMLQVVYGLPHLQQIVPLKSKPNKVVTRYAGVSLQSLGYNYYVKHRAKIDADLKIAVRGLYDNGFVHGDVYPRNVVIYETVPGDGSSQPQPHATLIDFGNMDEVQPGETFASVWKEFLDSLYSK